MNDSWTAQPYAPGVVLIGDATGSNDPIIGQGLSIALRDVRIVSDLLRGGSDWSTATFASYGAERQERMRLLRLSARVTTDLVATFTPARRPAYEAIWQTDPVLAGPRLIQLLVRRTCRPNPSPNPPSAESSHSASTAVFGGCSERVVRPFGASRCGESATAT
jgi:2-polyprenyl-6-methoxyphenol hydroxylase-like FAD-dependent oxidoreductase